MRVLLVSPHFPPHHVGGVEYYTQRLGNWLRDAGHEPEVACVEEVRSGDRHEVIAHVDYANGYPVYRLDLVLPPETGGFRLHWDNPAVRAWFAERLALARPDVVHLHSGYLLGQAALSAASERSVPAVVTLHDLWFVCPRVTMMHVDMTRCSGPEEDAKCAWCLQSEQRRFRLPDRWTAGLAGRIARVGLRLSAAASGSSGSTLVSAVSQRRRAILDALAVAHSILSPSHFVRKQLEAAGVAPGRIRIVPYGIQRRATPLPDRSEDGGPNRALRIGYFGQLAPHKGIHVLVAAARSLRTGRFELVVHGPETPHVAYVAKLRELAGGDPRIRFAGAYDNSRMEELLATLDVSVVPSVWYENYPFVVLEAFRAGLPVVASRVGGLPEMIRDGADGLLFEPGSEADLARALERLVEERGLLERLRSGVGPVRSDEDESSELLAAYHEAAASKISR
jgi:glycosyltransferase involved in cell wall biosynthesis